MATPVRLEATLPQVRRRMGLIVGPGATLEPNFFGELAQSLSKAIGKPPSPRILEVGDQAAELRKLDEVRRLLQGDLKKRAPIGSAELLAAVRWSAVLSLSFDTFLEVKLQERASDRPLEPPVATISDLLQAPPPRSLPVYKLLGTAQREDIALTRLGYTQRRVHWRRVVRAFSDYVRDAAVVIYGVGDAAPFLDDLLVELISDATRLPSQFFVLESEPYAPQLQKLLGDRLKIVSASLGEFVHAAYKPGTKTHATRASESSATGTLNDLKTFADVAVPVNLHLTPTIARQERLRLLELLFAPFSLRWDPLHYDMDLRRTAGDELLVACKAVLGQKGSDSNALVLRGTAASGKTMVLKRLGLELARDGELVLWLKSYIATDARLLLTKMFEHLAKHKLTREGRVAIIVDDPLAMGSVTPELVVSCAASAGVATTFVLGVRSSDWGRFEQRDIVGPSALANEVELPDLLDDTEWTRLETLLVSLGLVTDTNAAKKRLAEAATRNSRDVLSTLYFLLPETRSAIHESVTEEYFRIGDVAGLSRVIVGGVRQTADVVQRAYKFAAVADRFRAPLPIEILVNALSVPYTEWYEAAKRGGAVLGLLYPDTSEGFEDTTCYRVRNGVVADIIVDNINGGRVNHSMELRQIEALLAACSGSQSLYREFVVRVLLSLDSVDWLSYEDGLRLFEVGQAALPFPDKTIAHQQGKWIRKRGNDPLRSIEVLKKALDTPNYPHSTRPEQDEHIHTSLARATLDGIEVLRIPFESGKMEVLRHLAKARSETFFNPNAIHVQAALIRKLVERQGTRSADSFAITKDALADLDRAILLIKAPGGVEVAREKDAQFLATARIQLLELFTTDPALEAEANRLWVELRSQDGFVVVGRAKLRRAMEETVGTRFNDAFAYVQAAIRRIEADNGKPSPALGELALHIYYSWRVQRSTGSVDWQLMLGFGRAALDAQRSRTDAFYQYLCALAYAHLGDWSEASALFRSIRQRPLPREMLWAPRDFLQDELGRPRTVQGELRPGAERRFFYSVDLGTDMPVDEREKWGAAGDIVHAQVRFSMGGPTAVRRA